MLTPLWQQIVQPIVLAKPVALRLLLAAIFNPLWLASAETTAPLLDFVVAL